MRLKFGLEERSYNDRTIFIIVDIRREDQSMYLDCRRCGKDVKH